MQGNIERLELRSDCRQMLDDTGQHFGVDINGRQQGDVGGHATHARLIAQPCSVDHRAKGLGNLDCDPKGHAAH
jgi:hypothetical protein